VALNAFYEKLRIYHNLFQPVMRLTRKTYDRETQRARRYWDTPLTPLQASARFGDNERGSGRPATTLYDRTDPLTCQELEADIRAIGCLCHLVAHSSDVHTHTAKGGGPAAR